MIEKEEKDEKWREVSINGLRKILYKDGFKIKQVDKTQVKLKKLNMSFINVHLLKVELVNVYLLKNLFIRK
jgi:PP-loop superfamily ATP-utilizing enzyme